MRAKDPSKVRFSGNRFRNNVVSEGIVRLALRVLWLSAPTSYFSAICGFDCHCGSRDRVSWGTKQHSRAPKGRHITAGRSDVILGEFELPGVVPGVVPRMPTLHFQTRGCRLLARNCLEMPQNSESLRKWPKNLRLDMRMTGFIVIGFRCGPNTLPHCDFMA